MPLEQFPYTNFHELNLDWVIKTVSDILIRTEKIELSYENVTNIVKDTILAMITDGSLNIQIVTNYNAENEALTIESVVI